MLTSTQEGVTGYSCKGEAWFRVVNGTIWESAIGGKSCGPTIFCDTLFHSVFDALDAGMSPGLATPQEIIAWRNKTGR